MYHKKWLRSQNQSSVTFNWKFQVSLLRFMFIYNRILYFIPQNMKIKIYNNFFLSTETFEKVQNLFSSFDNQLCRWHWMSAAQIHFIERVHSIELSISHWHLYISTLHIFVCILIFNFTSPCCTLYMHLPKFELW